jgi:RimJ/RimL family protein N-acetyltransferase
MDIQIKETKKQDVEFLIPIQRSAFFGEAEKYQHYEHAPEFESIEEMKGKLYASDRTTYYSIFLKDEIVGAIIVTDFTCGEYYIMRIFIEPKHQGKGIGKNAILLLKKEIEDIKKLFLLSAKDNKRNKKFYSSLGFKINGKLYVNKKLTYLRFEKIYN